MTTEEASLLRALLDEQRAQVAELRALRADLAMRREAGPLAAADYVVLGPLLTAVAEQVGPDEFKVCELIEMPALEEVIAGRNAKALGRLFERAAGIPVAGYVVRRWGEERGITLWSVEELRQ
jgi:hypothetical protein